MFGCCQPASRPARPAGGGPRASDLGEGTRLKQSPAETPPLGIEMMRSKSELRILQPAVSLKDGIGGTPISCSARSLWEASAYRMAYHELYPGGGAGQPDSDDQGIPQRFIDAYVAALRDHKASWATVPAVADLFAEEVRLVGQDKTVTTGKVAVLRRLEKGTDMLIKMAGKDAPCPEWDVAGPRLTEAQTHELKCTIKRGMMKLTFVLEFLIVGGKILHMRNTRS